MAGIAASREAWIAQQTRILNGLLSAYCLPLPRASPHHSCIHSGITTSHRQSVTSSSFCSLVLSFTMEEGTASTTRQGLTVRNAASGVRTWWLGAFSRLHARTGSTRPSWGGLCSWWLHLQGCSPPPAAPWWWTGAAGSGRIPCAIRLQWEGILLQVGTFAVTVKREHCASYLSCCLLQLLCMPLGMLSLTVSHLMCSNVTVSDTSQVCVKQRYLPVLFSVCFL